VTLTDTGSLVALIDEDDAYHQECASRVPELPPPMVAPWPCFTEAMHLLNRAGGHRAQEKLWNYVTLGALIIHASSVEEQTRMREMMVKYSNVPVDLADAALVAAAEVLGVQRIFSIDSDFYIYRLANGTTLEVVPGPAKKAKR
jgi:predicted nucleic acid-binding protein